MYREARAYIAGIVATADLDAEAVKYFKVYADYLPDHFLETSARKRRGKNKALDSGDGWACRLYSSLSDPHAYTLHASHLGLPPECSDPANFYTKANRDHWHAAVKAAFASPLHWKLELAERVHVHVIADKDAGLPHLKRGGEVIKPITNYEGWLYYIAKPVAQWNACNMALWLKAKRRGRLPRMSGTSGLANRKTFHQGTRAS